jgi:hypothetical protein
MRAEKDEAKDKGESARLGPALTALKRLADAARYARR